MNVFNAKEIIDMGIEKEKKRRDFYALVAEKLDGKESKDLFTKLSDWEKEHIEKFQEIGKTVKQTEATDSYPGELGDYIKSLVDDRLYNEVSPTEFANNVKKASDAIQYGIGFEKDAILFFREVLSFMETAHKEAIEELIEEEKKHIVYLAVLRKKLTK